ncbi:hypothetical protein MTO96_040004, partial [Rhipicephalus appendiculatus]
SGAVTSRSRYTKDLVGKRILNADDVFAEVDFDLADLGLLVLATTSTPPAVLCAPKLWERIQNRLRLSSASKGERLLPNVVCFAAQAPFLRS